MTSTLLVTPAWSAVVGSGASRVVVYEDLARGRQLTLRWWGGKNWKRKALGKTLERDRRGNVTSDSEQWAKDQATVKSAALIAGTPEATVILPQRFTIGEARDAITDEETGKYPHDTPYRRELLRALDFAVLIWKADTPWSAIEDKEWTMLVRRRVSGLLHRGLQGIRSTEITVSRINTAAQWLRDQKKIPRDAAIPPRTWRRDLLDYWRGEMAKRAGQSVDTIEDPSVARPRHTLDEMRKIIAAAPKVDPRFALLVQLAAEYRLGQARRAKRSHLKDNTFTITGRGKKVGALVDLTPGQQAAWATAIGTGGYLEALEAKWLSSGKDYFLFPSGKMFGWKKGEWEIGDGIDLSKPVSREWVIKNFHKAERIAEVPELKGRGAYGLRRQNVDAANALGISGLGKQASGGWSSTKVPDSIYAESTNSAGRAEAARARATTRGEV
jgi:hypothetical protein